MCLMVRNRIMSMKAGMTCPFIHFFDRDGGEANGRDLVGS